MKLWKYMLASLLLLTGCTPAGKPTETSAPVVSQEPAKNAGKIELTTLPTDMSAYMFLDDPDHVFEEVTTEESLKLFVNGTGIVIYSYETCPWCNRVMPVLNEAAKAKGVKVFYVNIYSDAFMQLSNQKKSDQIQALYTCLDPILDREKDETTGKEKPVMQVPEVVAVKDGKITAHHMGIVDGFKLDPDKLSEYQVSKSQVKELKNIYLELIDSIK